MRLRRSVLVLVSSFVLLPLAQPWSQAGAGDWAPTWSRRAGTTLNSVTVDEAGNVYVTGLQERPGVRTNMLLRSYTASGSLRWTRSWRPPGADLVDGNAIHAAPGGIVYVVGDLHGRGAGEGGGWFLRAYTSSGALRWSRTSPDWRRTDAERLSGVSASSTMVAVSGYDFGCCSDPARDGWVIAYDTSGSKQWARRFEAKGVPNGTNDQANSIAVGSLGNVYVAGWIEMRERPRESTRVDVEFLIQKLSSSGHTEWSRILRDHDVKDFDSASAIAVRGDVLAVAGLVNRDSFGPSPRDPGHAWLGALTFDGHLRWHRTWGVRSRNAAEPHGMGLGPGGTIYVAGAKRDRTDNGLDPFLRKYSDRGRLLRAFSPDTPAPLAIGTDTSAFGGSVYTSGYNAKEFGEPLGGWLRRLEA